MMKLIGLFFFFFCIYVNEPKKESHVRALISRFIQLIIIDITCAENLQGGSDVSATSEL